MWERGGPGRAPKSRHSQSARWKRETLVDFRRGWGDRGASRRGVDRGGFGGGGRGWGWALHMPETA